MLDKMSHLNQRLIVGSLTSCLILGAIYFSSFPYFRPIFALIAAAIVGGAVWEYYEISKVRGARPLETLGCLSSIVYVIAVFWATQEPAAALAPSVVLGSFVLFGFLYYFFKGGNPIVDLAVTFFPFIYLTIPLSFLVSVNYYFHEEAVQDGRWWLVFLVLTSKMSDTGAFFFGKMFGRSQLAPEISPKKTWEGAIGGTLLSLLCAALLYFATNALSSGAINDFSLWTLLGLGFIMSVFSQIGDLSESLLKRDAGVKDSNQLPGLGGLLDIVDSLVFTTPILYLFLRVMYIPS